MGKLAPRVITTSWTLGAAFAVALVAGCSGDGDIGGADGAPAPEQDGATSPDAAAALPDAAQTGADDASPPDAAAPADAAPPDAAAPVCEVACDPPLTSCELAICEGTSCSVAAREDESACDDGNPCTTNTTCGAGACGGGELLCSVPSGLALSEPVPTDLGGVGSPTLDACEPGEVLIGFSGSRVVNAANGTRNWILGVQGECASASLVWDELEAAYRVETTPTENLPLREAPSGGNATQSWERRCPDDQVIVGFSGTFATDELYVESLVLRCASVHVVRDGDWQVELGPVVELDRVGVPQSLSSELFGPTDCAAEALAVGQQTSTRNIFIQGFGLTCADASLEF
jgi:hypothetical protein